MKIRLVALVVSASLLAFTLSTESAEQLVKLRGERICEPRGERGGQACRAVVSNAVEVAIDQRDSGNKLGALINEAPFVYTTGEVDALIQARFATLEVRVAASENQLAQQKAAFEDSITQILLKVDALASELPSDNGFYTQMLARLRQDLLAAVD